LWWGSWAVLALFSPTVSADSSGFRAGKASISWEHIGSIEAIPQGQFRNTIGVDLDARAWLVIRPWVGTAVKVVVNDPDDPTPYWVVSTTKPNALVEVSALHLGAR